jgi:hypothetical protein
LEPNNKDTPDLWRSGLAREEYDKRDVLPIFGWENKLPLVYNM